MTRQGQETRLRLIRAAVALYQSRGYHATGVSAILDHAGVPKGSMYHHFPGGKQALTIAAVDHLAEDMAARFARTAEGGAWARTQITRLFTDAAARKPTVANTSWDRSSVRVWSLRVVTAQAVVKQSTSSPIQRVTFSSTSKDPSRL